MTVIITGNKALKILTIVLNSRIAIVANNSENKKKHCEKYPIYGIKFSWDSPCHEPDFWRAEIITNLLLIMNVNMIHEHELASNQLSSVWFVHKLSHTVRR